MMEYTIILGIIALVLMAMGPMLKRGTQGLIKLVSDQIGVQNNAEQAFDERGHLESTYISVRSKTNKISAALPGKVGYGYLEQVDTRSNELVNMGFTQTQ